MHQLDIALAIVAAAMLALGLVSRAVKKGPCQEPTVTLALGILVGPYVLGWLDLGKWGEESGIREQAARITLAIALMGVALRLTPDDLRRLWKPATILLTAGMIGMWLASSLAAGLAFGLALWPALLLGAVITPTDPVAASAIVTGRFAREKLPRRVRAGLSLEAGANDGLAYLLVFLPLLMLAREPGAAWHHWLVDRLLVGVLAAVALGVAIGWIAARLLHWAHERELIEDYSLLTFTIALSLFTLGGARLLAADALISVFVAGLAFTLTSDLGDKHREENVQESIAKLFSLPMFFLIGLALPWSEWLAIGWPVLLFAVLALLLRRPPVLALLIPALRGRFRPADTLFMGWFGPIGVAAVYYASLAEKESGEAFLWHAASAAVFASVVAHGLTAAPFARLRMARTGEGGEGDEDEEARAQEDGKEKGD